MQHRNSHLFLEHWESLRDGASLPNRKDFDPDQIKHLLVNVLILDVQDPNAPRYRFAGNDLRKRHGNELTGGIFFAGWDRDSITVTTALLNRAIVSKRPVCLSSIGRAEDSGPVQLETVLAPFKDEDGCIFIGHSQKLADHRTLTDRPLTSQRLIASRLVQENDAHLLFRPQQHVPTRSLLPA